MEKTITELWVEQAKSRGKCKILNNLPIDFASENKYTYDFRFEKNNHFSSGCAVVIFCQAKTISRLTEEWGYSFDVRDKQVIWEHFQNAQAYLPDDLKKYIEKYILENEINYE